MVHILIYKCKYSGVLQENNNYELNYFIRMRICIGIGKLTHYDDINIYGEQ